MKALVCIKPGELEYREIDAPLAGPGQAIIKIRRVGICGTDLHAYEGVQPYFDYPRILGHELAGDLVDLDSAPGFIPGEAVTVIPYFACGDCVACRSGKPNCCVRVQVCGVHIDGGMADYLVVPSSALVHGDGLSYDELALVEPLAIGAHAVRRAAVTEGEFVLVVGAGPIGLGILEAARIAGGQVIAMDINTDRLRFCRDVLQVLHTVLAGGAALGGERVMEELKEITRGELPTVVIDATGSRQAINDSFQYLAHGGRYVLVGLQKGEICFSHPEFHKREATLMSSRNATREDFAGVMDAMRTGRIDPTRFITHRVEREQVAVEFGKWLNPAAGVIKVMVAWMIVLVFGGALSARAQDLKLWYKQPAAIWTEALPLGNGRLGAMVFGRVNEDLIQLNESSLWSGGPVPSDPNPGASAYLPQIREALEHEDYDKARMLDQKMQGPYSESYLPLGDLLIRQDIGDAGAAANSYYRDLDIGDAIATTRFTIDGTLFTRQVFVSYPDQVIVIRLLADRAGKLNFGISAKSLLHSQSYVSAGNEYVLKGKAPAHVDPSYYHGNKEPVVYADSSSCKGMRFEYRIKVQSTDGKLSADSSGLQVRNATEAILLVSAATSFNGFDRCPDRDGKDEEGLASAYLAKASGKSWKVLLDAHLADYHHYFNRVSLMLKGDSNGAVGLPTDLRLQAYSKGGSDPGLEALYFQYGRYLLISSSRPGGQASNLQGIWNKDLRAPWSSNYTININTEMNYWPAEVTNLSEMGEPLFGLIESIAATGKATAKNFYGLEGWVAHHNSDIWAMSNPVGGGGGDPRWANWAMGGNWLCRHLWEHYLFTGDAVFLRDTAYPLMKGAAEFCLGWLVEDKNGHLVTAPSTSPENEFYYTPEKKGTVSIATTMDISIIRDLFDHTAAATALLGTDKDFGVRVMQASDELLPLQIGHKGNLQEWYKDFDDVEVQHRHVSHLFGLYPGDQISPILTPVFAKAAKRTLEIRGDVGTGWSKAWKINFWARLLDGDHAYLLLRQLLHYTIETGTHYDGGGGTYPDLFDAHPPFQIDGNFGATAGMAEMLIQSQSGEIHLLPALPAAWKDGEVSGLRARGGFEVSMHWANHRLVRARVVALVGGRCHIRTGSRVRLVGAGHQGAGHQIDSKRDGKLGYVLSFDTEKGKIYALEAL